MKAIFLATSLLAVASFASGQAPQAPALTDGRVSNGHIRLYTKDPEAQRHFWVDIMGATQPQTGPDVVYLLPKVTVIVNKGTPTAGTEGSIVNHIGFRVRDIKDILAKLEAEHFTVQVVNPNRDNPNQIFFLGPDNVRIELLAGPNLTTVSENHQVHFFTPDIDAMQKWYVDHFGAAPQSFGKAKMANLPGVTLIFSPTDMPVTGTKGRALDHIGFAVKDLESFSKDLEASGVTLDFESHRMALWGFAVVLTDPWGTLIELTEHPAPATSARQQ